MVPEFQLAGPGTFAQLLKEVRTKLPSLDPDLHFQNKQTKTFRMFQIMCILC